MIHIFSNSSYRGEAWATERRLRKDQYKVHTRPEFISGLYFGHKDRLIVVGVISQFMLNAIQAARGAPREAPHIEFYP